MNISLVSSISLNNNNKYSDDEFYEFINLQKKQRKMAGSSGLF